jgi:alpha-ketoglutarate-dependent taurine dioxygenase
MKRLLSILLWIALVAIAGVRDTQAATLQPPAPPMTPSPVEMFRRLIATNEAGRQQWMASKTPEARRVIEAKLREYGAMPAAVRDAKLRELQLRWQVQQLMRMKPADRAQQLATIADPDRTVVAERIGRLSILPPPLQQAVLTNPVAITLIARSPLPRPGEDPRRREQIERLTAFVEMRESERLKVLQRLSPAEQQQMEKTLSSFAMLSREGRQEAMQGFRRFAQMSESERTAFLSTAERWRTMSEADREFWRRIVSALERQQATPPLPSSARVAPPAPQIATN